MGSLYKGSCYFGSISGAPDFWQRPYALQSILRMVKVGHRIPFRGYIVGPTRVLCVWPRLRDVSAVCGKAVSQLERRPDGAVLRGSHVSYLQQ